VTTTQRTRSYHFPFYTPEELGKKLIPITQEHRVAIVFGREDSGLTNEEIRCCHAISTIPAATKHPSLNLAQAVMLYSYELFKSSYGEEKQFHWRLAGYEEMENLFRHLQESLQRVNFKPRDNWDHFMMRFRRFFARANPEVRDVNLMHKIIQAYEHYIEQMERKLKEEK
ncbi:MAG: RNA methyltransferase, partial [Calditrichaeota bacterium]